MMVFMFRLVDTAGLRDTDDPIEMIGTDRARSTVQNSDLILLVVDPLDGENLEFEKNFISDHSDKKIILVYNKNDLEHKSPKLKAEYSISISALKRAGITELAKMMSEIIKDHFHFGNDTVAITRQRHKRALQDSLAALNRTEDALRNNMSNEFLALDIREAISALDDITGHTSSEDVLNNIFDQFCIGK